MIRLFALLALFSSLFSATGFAEEQQILDNSGFEAFQVEGLEKLAEGSSGFFFTRTHSFYQLSSGNICQARGDEKLCYELSCPTRVPGYKGEIVCSFNQTGQFWTIFNQDPRNMENGSETTVKTVTSLRRGNSQFNVKIVRD